MVLTREQTHHKCASWMCGAWSDKKFKCATWFKAETVYELYVKETASPMSKETFLCEIYDIIGILNWDCDYNENLANIKWEMTTAPPKAEYKVRICPRRKKETLMIYRIKL